MKWLIFFILTLVAVGLYWRYSGPTKEDKSNPSKTEESLEQTETPRVPLPNSVTESSPDNSLPLPNSESGSPSQNLNPPPLVMPPQAPPPNFNPYPQELSDQLNIDPSLDSLPPIPPVYPENDLLNSIPPGDNPSPFEPPPPPIVDDFNNGFAPPTPMDEGEY